MKILLAHTNCLVGGVEIMMASLAQVLRARGHQCDFFFFERGPMVEQLPEGSAVYFGDLADCMKLVSSERYDIVQVNSYDWLAGISAVRNFGARLLVMAQGANGINPSWTSATCDAFTTCSRWLAAEQKVLTDLEPHAIPNGIDTSLFKPAENSSDGSPIVAWVGRGIDSVKQIGRFAEVAPLLHRAGLRLRLAEPYGPEEVERALQIDMGELRRIAEFWGSVPQEGMPAFYQEVAASGGCVLSTSVIEGLGIAMLEAQACGCLAIGPDVPGINESVNPAHGGTLYDPHLGAKQLANLVLDTLSATDLKTRRRQAGIQFVREKFTLKGMGEGYLRAYEEALNSKRKKRLFALWSRGFLSPLLHWNDYVTYRWGPGRCQYEASLQLAERGDWTLAAVAARAALLMSPTIFVRPGRLIHLLKTLGRGAAGRRSLSGCGG